MKRQCQENPGNQNPCHSLFSGGIICGPRRGSFAVRDHLRSNLGIIFGRGSFAPLYSLVKFPPELESLETLTNLILIYTRRRIMYHDVLHITKPLAKRTRAARSREGHARRAYARSAKATSRPVPQRGSFVNSLGDQSGKPDNSAFKSAKLKQEPARRLTGRHLIQHLR